MSKPSVATILCKSANISCSSFKKVFSHENSLHFFVELAISKLEEANRVFFIAQTNISANYNDEAEISTANIAWSSCKDFNEKVGLKEIEAFVQVSGWWAYASSFNVVISLLHCMCCPFHYVAIREALINILLWKAQRYLQPAQPPCYDQ